MPQRTTRSAKLDVRLTPEAKRTLVAAAAAARRSVSEFVLESALVRARGDSCGSRTAFTLNAERWKAFLEMLDAPPRGVPRLKRLFRERSLFEGSSRMTATLRIEKLQREHEVDAFDCRTRRAESVSSAYLPSRANRQELHRRTSRCQGKRSSAITPSQ